MATEEQRKRDAAQKRNARRIRSGQPLPRASGLSPEAVRGYRQRASERSNARQRGNPPPPPLKPPRVPVNPATIAQDRAAIRARQGGYTGEMGDRNRQWIEPRLTERGGFLPRSDIEYQNEEGTEVSYDTRGIFPRYNPVRENEEAYLFRRSGSPDEPGGEFFSSRKRRDYLGDEPAETFIPLTYYPTKTSWPGNGFDHRRTIAAGYSRARGIIRIQFYTDGAIYDYGTKTPIPPSVAYQFRLTQSPGRAVHAGPGWGGSSLESYGFERIN